jgi:large subunit ribosomal protein L13e
MKQGFFKSITSAAIHEESSTDRSTQQAAGIPRKLAPTIGISVDHRRQTTSEETLALNVQRLKSYRARLILFPLKAGQHKKLDSSPEDLKLVSDADKIVKSVGSVLPVQTGTGVEAAISEIKKGDMPEGEKEAYVKLRKARADQRHAGMREKRAKAKAEAEEAKKK